MLFYRPLGGVRRKGLVCICSQRKQIEVRLRQAVGGARLYTSQNKIEESQHPLRDASFFYGLSLLRFPIKSSGLRFPRFYRPRPLAQFVFSATGSTHFAPHGLKIARQLSIFTPVCALVPPFRVPSSAKKQIPGWVSAFLVRWKGLEPLTYWFVASHSIQLSYQRITHFPNVL